MWAFKMDIMSQSTCLVLNPITVYSYDSSLIGWSGLRLNDDLDLKLSTVVSLSWCLMLALLGWAKSVSAIGIFLALTVCELRVLFAVPSWL